MPGSVEYIGLSLVANNSLISERRGGLGTGDQNCMADDGRECDGERRCTYPQEDQGIEID